MTGKTAKIIVTIDETRRMRAEADIRAALKAVGAERVHIINERPAGKVGAWVPGDPRKVVELLEPLYESHPHLFAHTSRWLPVESWAGDDPRDIEAYMRLFRRTLGDDESWTVAVEELEAGASARDLARQVLSLVDDEPEPVDDPDRTFLMNVIGHRVGYADVHRGQIFEPGRP